MRGRLVALVFAFAGMLAMPLAAGAAERPATADRFIVTLRDSSDSRSVAAEYRRGGANIDFVYAAALNGFAGAFSDSTLGQLRADGRVARIEPDGIATASATTQAGATWGLDRIDQQTLPLSTTYSYERTGAGVTAYIVDTGILFGHSEFGGRASSGFDAVDGGSADDCNGHGTHVAGTVGGTTYGVAKGVSLVAVRVLDCNGSGSWSGVIAGLDWVAANHHSPAVANMSLGGGASTSVDDAVKRTISSGVTVAVAAGNGNKAGVAQDACASSPSRVPEALTIGATDKTDTKTSWSNYGSCVDLFAPGLGITSSWYTNDSATNTISGTSMATPHVTGVAALYLDADPTAAPATVATAITAGATPDIVKSSSSSPNNDLLYSLIAPAAPVATGTITGTVTAASDGTPVAATVTAGGVSRPTGTDGSYTLSSVPVGDQVVQVSATGYVSQSVTVSVTEGATATKSFTLETAPTPPADTMTLTLTKGSKTRNVTPVTASWTDTGSYGTYDVWANGSWRATNVSGYSYTMTWRGSGTLTYHVCRSNGTLCSADVSITV